MKLQPTAGKSFPSVDAKILVGGSSQPWIDSYPPPPGLDWARGDPERAPALPFAIVAGWPARSGHRDIMTGTKKSPGPILVPGVWLSNIAVGLRLSGVEWRILSLVLAAPRPLATWRIAKYLKLEYTHAKRAVRALIASKI